MNIDVIVIIIIGMGFVVGFISLIVWALSKNKKIAKFFRKLSDWIGENWRW